MGGWLDMTDLAPSGALQALLPALLAGVGLVWLGRAPRSVPPPPRPPAAGRRLTLAWRVAGGLLAAATALWWGGAAGLVAGAVVGPVTAVLGVRASSRWGDSRSRIPASQPALAADLLAATVGAGVPLTVATHAVASSMTGPFARRLGDVALRTGAGAPAGVAHEPLLTEAATASIGRALVRAHGAGASPVPLLSGAASRERERDRSERVGRARSAGSLAALPLGLLFLPAFVLVAVVPVVVGALGPVLAG
jgi:Flp pilus assembly protein TadB